MLPKKNRLTSHEVGHVLKHGKIVRAPACSLRYSTAVNSLKFGVVVSKKVAQTNVLRHAVKRAVYREIQHDMRDNPQAYAAPLHAAITITSPAKQFLEAGTHTTIVSTLRKCFGTV